MECFDIAVLEHFGIADGERWSIVVVAHSSIAALVHFGIAVWGLGEGSDYIVALECCRNFEPPLSLERFDIVVSEPVDTVVLEHFDIVVWARFDIVDEVLVAERCCRLDEESVGTVVWEPVGTVGEARFGTVVEARSGTAVGARFDIAVGERIGSFVWVLDDTIVGERSGIVVWAHFDIAHEPRAYILVSAPVCSFVWALGCTPPEEPVYSCIAELACTAHEEHDHIRGLGLADIVHLQFVYNLARQLVGSSLWARIGSPCLLLRHIRIVHHHRHLGTRSRSPWYISARTPSNTSPCRLSRISPRISCSIPPRFDWSILFRKFVRRLGR